MSDKKEKALAKARKLLNLKENVAATEAEAKNAGEKLQALLDKFNLDMSDIGTDDRKNQNVVEENIDLDDTKTRTWWSSIAGSLAHIYNCKVIITDWWDDEDKKTKCRLVFIGSELELKVCGYYFNYLYHILYFLAEDSYEDKKFDDPNFRDTRAGYRDDFVIGAMMRIRDRLEEYKRKSQEEHPELYSLMVVRKEEVEKYVKSKFPRLKKGRSYKLKSRNGYSDGNSAGAGVSLNQGLKQKQGQIG